jgi:hypothetical protein
MPSKGVENSTSRVQVITAGGAGSGGAKSQRRAPTISSVQSERPFLDDDPTTKQRHSSHNSNTLEYEDTEAAEEAEDAIYGNASLQKRQLGSPYNDDPLYPSNDALTSHNDLGVSPPSSPHHSPNSNEVFWLFICFIGIMFSFVAYGLLLEYTTSGGRKLHELSFLFVTSGLYTLTAAAGRHVRDETPTTIPPARFAILGLTSMGSTFCSVRSLR